MKIHPRRFTHYATAAALILVFVGLASFSIVERLHSDSQREEISRRLRVSAAYSDARLAALDGEKSAYRFLVSQDPATLEQIPADANTFRAAMAELSAEGGPAEKAAAATILTKELPRLQSAASTVDDLRQGRALDPGAGDPETVARISAILRGPGAAYAAETEQLLDAFDNDQQVQFFVSLAVYGGGLLLAGLFLWLSNRLGRRQALLEGNVQQLRRAVLTDPLTGLGNRRAFEEALMAHAAAPPPPGEPLTLAMVDVDQFKEVNDIWGHDRGDQLLRQVAGILVEHVGHAGRVFRIGGDEFSMLLPLPEAECAAAMERARLAAEAGLPQGITLSVGIASRENAGYDEALLRQAADAALYEAKLRGRNLVVCYSPSADQPPLFPAARLLAVRNLLVEGRLETVFQPMSALASGEVFAFEALARPHPDYELSGPMQAFEIAERFGRVAELDRLCRERALASCQQLPEGTLLFVNLSPYSLTHHSFSAAALEREVLSAGLDPRRVVFEVTERSPVAPEVIADAVLAMQERGFAVALDDVGAGSNGLEMLRKVPVQYAKIDREIILAAMNGGVGRAALMAVLAFAAESNRQVVAEGIEDEETWAFVRELARGSVSREAGLVHAVQGFLFGLPVPGFTVEPMDRGQAA